MAQIQILWETQVTAKARAEVVDVCSAEEGRHEEEEGTLSEFK